MVDSSIQTLTHKLHKEFLSETTIIYTWAKQGIQERKERKESILVMAQKMDLSLNGLTQKLKDLVQAHICTWKWSTPSTSLGFKSLSNSMIYQWKFNNSRKHPTHLTLETLVK